ncbi:NAD-dependent epimerase/dehydratase family protein [Jiangella asiatica]|uniref:NAD(P)-dependent oxidoreductase n=1 Tax=Jiangella asiatica TaxID=2530372 RepID=A0A4R5DIV0_9ACTN|nr:NAD(P)-dependent oxidoreductase [Jiangella asiatica]TDE10433.1 NAD(P)-dependent oxidoreductase [Jiangella asiatica]
MRVLVTGGSGRLGESVVDGLLQAGHDVVSVDLREPRQHRDTWFPADLTVVDEASWALARVRPEAVVHLAAIAVPFSRPEREILRTNTALAYNVCRSALDAGANTVVVASSPTVVGYGAPTGWTPAYLPIDETHPVRPWNAYALSKLMAEQVMRMFTAQAGDRLRLSAIRPCYVIAEDEWAGAPTQQGHTVRERLDDPALAAGSLFNYVDARDAADFVGALLRRAHDIPNGETFFVGAGDALAREPLADLLPRFHSGTAGFADGLPGTAAAFSNAHAERLLGWKPERSWRTELR